MKLTLLPLLAFACACARPEPSPAPPAMTSGAQGITLAPDAPQWKYVELSVATEGPALSKLPSPGRVVFDEKRTANVGSPLAGRVESVEVRLGDRVKAGDRLFSVRSGAFAELERELESARADVAVKQRAAQRTRDLFALQATPEKEVQAAEAELKSSELALRAALAKKQSLKVGGAGDNLFWVTAPRAGTVVELDVSASQGVSPDRDHALIRINDLDEVLVLADLPETDVGDLAVGGPIVVRAQAGAITTESTIEFISPVVDPKRHTVEVRVRLPNASRRWRPNAFVEVVPAAASKLTLVKVPEAAVVTDGDRSVVFVAKPGGRLSPVTVQPGLRRDGEVEIRSGLEVGAHYVSRGALLLLNQVELTN